MRMKFLVLILLMGASGISYAQNTFPTTGNVGIGTTSPTNKLDIRGTITMENGTNASIFTGIGSTELNRYLTLLNSAGLSSASGLKAGGILVADAYAYANPGKNDLIVKGNVGIGVASPNEKLEVIGTTKSSLLKVADAGAVMQISPTELQAGLGSMDLTKRTLHYEISSKWDASQIQLRAGSSANVMSTIRLQANWNGTVKDNRGGIFFGPDGNDQHVMLNNGNVGIGTTEPQAKLAVNGNILAKEIKVKTDISAPDYVFEPDYKIQSLTEIESYVKAHKHLPEIPSAKEIGGEGLDLGEMNLLLLKKVEELTLHLIEKDKELTDVKDRLLLLEQAFSKQ